MKTKSKTADKNLLLKVRGLIVERGDTRILDSVDWTMHAGENWVILGPNGCGKTSLLKSLTGYLTPSDGDITLLGQVYRESDWRDLRLKVGIVTNAIQSGVPGGETVIETIISGKYAQLDLWMKPKREDRKEACALLDFVGMRGLEERLWVQLSQGERQRVLIARALMANPSLLILDEPCSGLDPVAREQFLKFIESLAHKAKAPAMVLVTHHVEEITPAFSHALLLKSGRVAVEGKIKDVLTSGHLSQIFSAPILLRKKKGRYSLYLKKIEGKSFGKN